MSLKAYSGDARKALWPQGNPIEKLEQFFEENKDSPDQMIRQYIKIYNDYNKITKVDLEEINEDNDENMVIDDDDKKYENKDMIEQL